MGNWLALLLLLGVLVCAWFLTWAWFLKRTKPESAPQPSEIRESFPPEPGKEGEEFGVGLRRIKREIQTTELEINDDFRRALELMEQTREHVFITGRAGTGKSTLLRLFKDNTRKNTVIVAPTGVAAINVGGSTIHSFFGFPLGIVPRDRIKKLHRKKELFKALESLIIDEISMVRADLMDAIDLSLRLNRGVDRPFGGVQVLLFGDLYQLPPVVDDREVKKFLDDVYHGCPYFFGAHVFQEVRLTIFELSKVFRQEDPEFLKLLDEVRKGAISDDHLKLLNSRVGLLPPKDAPIITLTARNDQASEINLDELRKLPGRQYSYEAVVTGAFDEKSYPTDRVLHLKEGAQVMLVKNDPYGRWVNGTLAVVKKLSDSTVKVFIDGNVYSVEPVTWEKLEYYYNPREKKIESRVVGSFRQLPLRLAWAVTIHKSQGQTFDRVIIDLGDGAFEYGQVYVALSRCRSLDGVYLRTPIRPTDVRTNPQVVTFETEFCKRCGTVSPQAKRRIGTKPQLKL